MSECSFRSLTRSQHVREEHFGEVQTTQEVVHLFGAFGHRQKFQDVVGEIEDEERDQT